MPVDAYTVVERALAEFRELRLKTVETQSEVFRKLLTEHVAAALTIAKDEALHNGKVTNTPFITDPLIEILAIALYEQQGSRTGRLPPWLETTPTQRQLYREIASGKRELPT